MLAAFVNDVGDGSVILIGGNGDETKQEPEEHIETLQSEADHVICAPIPMNPRMNRRAGKKDTGPGHRDKHNAKRGRYRPTRIVINPKHHIWPFPIFQRRGGRNRA